MKLEVGKYYINRQKQTWFCYKKRSDGFLCLRIEFDYIGLYNEDGTYSNRTDLQDLIMEKRLYDLIF